MLNFMVERMNLNQILEQELSLGTEYGDNPPMVAINDNIWKLLRKYCLYMTLAVTSRCNMRCAVCIMYDKKGRAPFLELSQDDVRYVMQKLGRSRKKIVLFGGEPTLRDDILELIQIIKQSGNIPMLYTNGIKLADPEYVKMLASSGLEKIYLSLDSLTEKATEILQGDARFLELKLKALENLKRYSRIKVWLSSMIAYGINHTEIPALIRKVIEDRTGVLRGIYLLAATNTNMSWYRLPSETALSLQRVLEMIEEAMEGVLSVEYIKEFTRLKLNLNSILKHIGARLPFTPERALLKRKKNIEVEPIASLSDVKMMNYAIENKKYGILIRYIWKYRTWFGLFPRVFRPEIVEFEACRRPEVIFIEPSYITVTPIHSLLSQGMTNVIKNESGFYLYAQGPI